MVRVHEQGHSKGNYSQMSKRRSKWAPSSVVCIFPSSAVCSAAQMDEHQDNMLVRAARISSKREESERSV